MTESKNKPITDFYAAWGFLTDHPVFEDVHGINRFQQCLTIDVVKVDPVTEKIMDDEKLNIATRVWLEGGYWEYGLIPDHPDVGVVSRDLELEVGGPTFEDAIIKMANLVLQQHGNYKRPEVDYQELKAVLGKKNYRR